MKSHLCGLTTTESARSTPSNAQRSSGQTIAEPAYAASTWSHAPCRSQRSATAGTGSTDVVEVVPTVATTAAVSSRASASASASGRMRNSASAGTLRSSRPRIRAALSTEECACSEQSTTPSGRSTRAAASAARVDVDAVSSMWPWNPSGRPTSSRSQSIVSSSSSVAAGPVRQSIAFTLSAAASSSARIPGSEPVIAKYAKKRGWFQCVVPGTITSSRSRRIASNGSACSGGEAGSCERTQPGSTAARTG